MGTMYDYCTGWCNLMVVVQQDGGPQSEHFIMNRLQNRGSDMTPNRRKV